MEKKRFFVGNLPHEIDEDVIRSRFSKYGEVLSVELKFCYSGLDQNEIISTFAFVNLQGSQESLSACMYVINLILLTLKHIINNFYKSSANIVIILFLLKIILHNNWQQAYLVEKLSYAIMNQPSAIIYL